MIVTCPTCRWPEPTLIFAHGSTRYLHCVCGLWLVVDRGAVIATPGTSAFTGSTP